MSLLILALQTLWGQGDYKEEMDEMLAEQAAIEAAPPKSPLQLLRDKTVRWQLMSMSIIYFCNQMSGMSAVRMQMFCFKADSLHPNSNHSLSNANQNLSSCQISIFSFDIFQKVGIPKDKIRYVTLGLGVCEIMTSVSCVSEPYFHFRSFVLPPLKVLETKIFSFKAFTCIATCISI